MKTCGLFVIRDTDGVALYLDTEGSARLTDLLFWGPEEAAVKARRYIATTAWSSSLRTRAAVLIDEVEHRLVFFSTDCTHATALTRATYCELLGYNWPGWTIEYAAGGLHDIAVSVGAELPGPVVEPHSDDELRSTNIADAVRTIMRELFVHDQGPLRHLIAREAARERLGVQITPHR